MTPSRFRRHSSPILALLTLIALVPVASGDDATPPMPEMTTYQFGMLRRGPAWTPKRTPATDSIQAGHMANIVRMAKEGYLIAAGPCLDGGDLRGIFVFRADSIATLRAQAARDPAIKAKRLTLELREWQAPVGLGRLYAERAKAPGHRDSMVVRSLIFVKRGPKWTDEASADGERIQHEHVAGVLRMLGDGRLAAAGPFEGEADPMGVFVFRTDTTEAKRLAAEDPGVKAGRMAMEFHPWFVAYGTFPGDTL
jgi:uncharacterized protein YciI